MKLKSARTLRVVAALFVSFTAVAAQAQTTVFFSDNFEANTLALNTVPTGWTVTNGTVDLVGPSLVGELCAGSGTCVDLDGSSNQAGALSRSFTLTGDVNYTLSFDLAGNRRGQGTETGVVSFGTTSINYTLLDTQTAYQALSLSFRPATTASYLVSFANAGGDNYGAILDNVRITSSVTAVPEPQSTALLLAGLLFTGAVARRRLGAR